MVKGEQPKASHWRSRRERGSFGGISLLFVDSDIDTPMNAFHVTD